MTLAVDEERAEWLEWRRGGLGASDLPKIMGVSGYGSAWSVWAERVGLLEPEPESRRQRIGKRMEPVLAAEFHDETGLYVHGEQTPCTHPEQSWARCTVDGFVTEGDVDVDNAIGVVEFKTDGRFGWEEIPEQYVIQCHWQMHVTGLPVAYLGVLFGGYRFAVYTIHRDQPLIDRMVAAAADVWAHCLDGTPPAVDGSEATAAALARAWPQHQEGETVDVAPLLVADWRKLRAQRLMADHLAKQLGELEREARNALVAAAGDAEIICIDGQPHLTLRTTTRDGYTVKPGSYRSLREVTR